MSVCQSVSGCPCFRLFKPDWLSKKRAGPTGEKEEEKEEGADKDYNSNYKGEGQETE